METDCKLINSFKHALNDFLKYKRRERRLVNESKERILKNDTDIEASLNMMSDIIEEFRDRLYNKNNERLMF